MNSQKGIAHIIFIVLILVLLVVAIGYFIYSQNPESTFSVKKSNTTEQVVDGENSNPQLSDSDEPETIEAEINSTDLGLDDLEEELQGVDAEVNTL